MPKYAEVADPMFAIGDQVSYLDHTNRRQIGEVKSIEARWDDYGRTEDSGFIRPLMIYTVSHPTYRNKRTYVQEQNMEIAP